MFIHSLIHSFTHSFTHSPILPFIHSFALTLVCWIVVFYCLIYRKKLKSCAIWHLSLTNRFQFHRSNCFSIVICWKAFQMSSIRSKTLPCSHCVRQPCWLSSTCIDWLVYLSVHMIRKQSTDRALFGNQSSDHAERIAHWRQSAQIFTHGDQVASADLVLSSTQSILHGRRHSLFQCSSQNDPTGLVWTVYSRVARELWPIFFRWQRIA